MVSQKFQRGDRVIILDGSCADDYIGGWNKIMNSYVGRECVVVRHWQGGYYLDNAGGYLYDPDYLEIVNDELKIKDDFDDRISAFFNA